MILLRNVPHIIEVSLFKRAHFEKAAGHIFKSGQWLRNPVSTGGCHLPELTLFMSEREF
jgi:hypothetical protein